MTDLELVVNIRSLSTDKQTDGRFYDSLGRFSFLEEKEMREGNRGKGGTRGQMEEEEESFGAKPNQ